MNTADRKLKIWQHPPNYMGATWYDYYVVIGQHRDSDRVTRSNFTVAKKMLEDCLKSLEPLPELPLDADGEEQSYLVNPCEGHWAVGHVEWLGVHKDSPKELLETAELMLSRIDNYPLLDEDHYSELEWKEVTEYWDSLAIQWRLRDYIQPAGLPCFAARHDISTIMHQYDASNLWDRLVSE